MKHEESDSQTATIDPPAGLVRPELLAPAGDWEALRAAAANGADAVYFGLNRFNARYRAANFSLDELPQVMAFLHDHNVRGYVAFNTLIFSEELHDALNFIERIAAAGVDAVIVQDLGLADLIGRFTPRLAVHASTQMTLTEPLGIEFVRALGVQRVILARELSVHDVRKIRAQTDIPLEIFVHGALCVSYSGQCLTSEALGGRSANRGQCAQACRLPYELIVDGQTRDLGDKAYLLSPQDLAAYDMIRELADAGICSFKIEGRLKSAQYVAAATQAYRAAIDALRTSQPFVLPRQQELDLAQSFSRGFTHGFLDGVYHQRLVHARFPKSRGVQVGRVVGATSSGVVIELETATASTHPKGFAVGGELSVGDGVVFDEGHPEQDEQGGRVASLAPLNAPGARRSPAISRGNRPSPAAGSSAAGSSGAGRRRVEVTFERGSVNLGAVGVGATVWKTDDPAVRRRLSATFARDRVARRVPLTASVSAAPGGALTVCVRDEQAREVRVSWPGPLQVAEKFPLTEALFREQFGRLGDTPFELSQVQGLATPASVMVPKSVLNGLRREATALLLDQRQGAVGAGVAEPNLLENLRREISQRFADASPEPAAPRLHVLTRTLEQLEAVLAWRSPADGSAPAGVYCDFEDVRKYKAAVAMARAAGIPVALATVRVVKPLEHGLIRQVAECDPDAMLIRNLAGLAYCQLHFPQMPLIADYSLNVANEATALLLARRGVRRMTPSYDLSWKQLAAMLTHFPAAVFEQVIHQHMPMFHMEHCVFAHTLSDGSDYRTCGRPCEAHQVDLKDRAGAAHPLIPDVGCRNTVFNSAAQSAAELLPRMKELGLRHFRIELLRESADASRDLLNRYARVLAGQEDGKATWRQLKVLNQLGVTRGTLDG